MWNSYFEKTNSINKIVIMSLPNLWSFGKTSFIKKKKKIILNSSCKIEEQKDKGKTGILRKIIDYWGNLYG